MNTLQKRLEAIFERKPVGFTMESFPATPRMCYRVLTGLMPRGLFLLL